MGVLLEFFNISPRLTVGACFNTSESAFNSFNFSHQSNIKTFGLSPGKLNIQEYVKIEVQPSSFEFSNVHKKAFQSKFSHHSD